jgi:biotin carboxyl carrier protein
MGRRQRYRIRVAGIDHEVEVDGEQVWVDGRRFTVDAAAAGASIVRDGASQTQVVLDPALTSAWVDGTVVAVEVRTPQQLAFEEQAAAHAGKSGAVMAAPMPGRIVRVLVAEGDTVEPDDPLVIIEAMKMENEVRAPVAGTVARLVAIAGQTVESGQLLCEIAAHPDPS